MTPFRRFQLSFLFFLEFFIWGGWFVTMGTFLSQEFNASGGQLALAYETQSIGAIIAPIVMALIYFVVLTPISLIVRIFGKDLLEIKFLNFIQMEDFIML